jgi:hypothetical protein
MSRIHLERLRIKMVAAGDRLRLALNVENGFGEPDREFQVCRRMVDDLAEEYLLTLHEWRVAVQAAIQSHDSRSARDRVPVSAPGLGRVRLTKS